MAASDWTNMVPGKDGTVKDYTPTNAVTETEKKNPDVGPEIEQLRGKVEFKHKSWICRTLTDFKRNWPTMLLTVFLPEAGKIFLNKTFDVIYSTIFNEPYYGGSSRNSGYFFKDNRVVDYTAAYFDARSGAGNTSSRQDLNKYRYDEFIFTSRFDVEDIIGMMVAQAKADKKVSVSDLYSIIRRTLKKNHYPREIIAMLETEKYTDDNYGWYYEDLRNAMVGTAGRDRYFLDLPQETAINR